MHMRGEAPCSQTGLNRLLSQQNPSHEHVKGKDRMTGVERSLLGALQIIPNFNEWDIAAPPDFREGSRSVYDIYHVK